MIIQKYEIDINLTFAEPCFILRYVTLLTTRKLVPLSSHTIRNDFLTGRTPTFLRISRSLRGELRFAAILLVLLHKQVGHIAEDWRCAVLARKVSFLEGSSAADFVFGQGE